jgi:hypothetical protein
VSKRRKRPPNIIPGTYVDIVAIIETSGLSFIDQFFPIEPPPDTNMPVAECATMSVSKRENTGYLPIENYGMIGNMRTCALISMDGSVGT